MRWAIATPSNQVMVLHEMGDCMPRFSSFGLLQSGIHVPAFAMESVIRVPALHHELCHHPGLCDTMLQAKLLDPLPPGVHFRPYPGAINSLVMLWEFAHLHIQNDLAQCAFSGKQFTLEDAIGSHACSLRANMRVTNCISLGSALLLPLPS
jgi:hypothetical protein